MSYIDTHPLRTAFVANILERLVRLIVDQGEELLHDSGIEFPPRTLSIVMLLGEQSRLSAADIAKALDHPHQVVTQRVGFLIDMNIVRRSADPNDARRKALELTATGRKRCQQLMGQLALIDKTFEDLFEGVGCNFPAAAVATLEALRRSSILDRVRALESQAA